MKTRKYKLVVDTNIFLYSIVDKEDGIYNQLSKLIEANKVNILFSQDTFGELIGRTKHYCRYNVDTKKESLKILHSYVDLFYNSITVNAMKIKFDKSKDVDDNMFMQCAIKGNADYFISEDKKHGMNKMDLPVKVITTDNFLKIINVQDKVAIEEL